MCKQFKVDRVWHMKTNTPHFDASQVFADAGSEVYRYTGPSINNLSRAAWPSTGVLYRDYWEFHCDRNDDNGPYFQRVIDADRTIIREV